MSCMVGQSAQARAVHEERWTGHKVGTESHWDILLSLEKEKENNRSVA